MSDEWITVGGSGGGAKKKKGKAPTAAEEAPKEEHANAAAGVDSGDGDKDEQARERARAKRERNKKNKLERKRAEAEAEAAAAKDKAVEPVAASAKSNGEAPQAKAGGKGKGKGKSAKPSANKDAQLTADTKTDEETAAAAALDKQLASDHSGRADSHLPQISSAAEASDLAQGWVDDILKLKDADGWQACGRKGATDCFKRLDEGSPFVLVKGIAEIKGSVRAVYDFVRGLDHLAECDTMFIPGSGSVLQTLSDSLHINHGRWKFPFPLSNRDFVWLETNHYQKQKAMVVSKSVFHPDSPANSGDVRGEIRETGYIIEKLTKSTCKLTYIVCGDPKGMLPVWVVNLVAMDQAKNVQRVYEVFEKQAKGEQN